MQSSDFSALYQSSYPYIYQLVFSVNQNQQAVEDTVQEIYLAAWIRFRRAPHPNPFGWLVLTARHKASDMLRRQLREEKRCVPLDLSENSLPLGTCHTDSDTPCLWDEYSVYSHIRPLLRKDEFDLLIARYEQGFSIGELAEQLRISPSACYMRIHRIRLKLAPLISPGP